MPPDPMFVPSRQVEQKPEMQRIVLAAVPVVLEPPGDMVLVEIAVFH